MSRGRWAELWRPFLDVSPRLLSCIDSLIFESMQLLGENEIEIQAVTRGMKLFAHYCSDPACMDLLLSSKSSLSFSLLLKSIIRHASPLSLDTEPNIRENSLLALCALSSHQDFLTWIVQSNESPSFSSLLSKIAVVRVQDPSIQTSEMAVEFLTRWITVGCILDPHIYTIWKESIIEANRIGEQLAALLEESDKGSTQIVITNLVIELTCPLQEKKNPILSYQSLSEEKQDQTRNKRNARNYYRGRTFVHRYHLASGAFFYLNSSDRIVRFRVVELLQSLTKEFHHFLLLPEAEDDRMARSDGQSIEMKFLFLLEKMMWIKQNEKQSILIQLYAQLASSLSFQYKTSAQECMTIFFLPPMLYLLSILFVAPENNKKNKKNRFVSSHSPMSNRDIVAIATRLMEACQIFLVRCGNYFLTPERAERIKYSPLLQHYHEQIKFWVLKLSGGDPSYDVLDIVVQFIYHPALSDRTAFMFQWIRTVRCALLQDVPLSLWKETQLQYQSSDGNEDCLIDILILCIRDGHSPAAVLVEVYGLLLFLLESLVKKYNVVNSRVVAKVVELVQLEIAHPVWDHNDAAIHFIGDLYELHIQILTEQLVEHPFVSILLESLSNLPNEFVRASAFHTLVTISKDPSISTDHLVSTFEALKSSGQISLEGRSFSASTELSSDFLGFLLSFSYDNDDMVRREVIFFLNTWLGNVETAKLFVSFLSRSEAHRSFFENALRALVLNDSDWEVKRKGIELLRNLWTGFHLGDDELDMYVLLSCFIGADKILLESNGDADRIPRKESYECLGDIKNWFLALPLERREKLLELHSSCSPFFHSLGDNDFIALAESCSIEEVYPDETDLRTVSTEADNPIGCY